MKRSVLAALVVLASALVPWGQAAVAGNPDHVTQLLETGSCTECDLSGEAFELLQADGANLAGTSLVGAELYRASLIGAALSGADLTNALLERADLTDADLSYAVLVGANLALADLTGAVTTGAETDETTICPDETAGPCAF